MKIVIISDIHGNLDALEALTETYDELWVLGDLVNYGPQPREVTEAVRTRADLVIQGNHDFAVGHEDDSRWSARYRAMAEATRRYSSAQLSAEQLQYLRDLPLWVEVEREGVRFHLTHATPSDRHYGRLAPNDDGWIAEVAGLAADVLLVGHSHVPFIRQIGDTTIVNPGSIGQPRSGEARASYAVWEHGRFELRSFHYPVESTIARLKALSFPPAVEGELAMILRTGIS